jgi:hypothetical protein
MAIARIAGLVAAAAIMIVLAGCNSQEGTAFDNQNYSPTAGGAFDPTTLKTTDSRSLFLGSNYHKPFAIAERKLGAGAEIEDAELYPGQLALTVLSHGKQLSVAVQYNGEYGSKSGGPLSGSPAVFRLADLAGDIPAELAGRIAKEAHMPIAHLHYMIVAPGSSPSKLYWMVYTADTSLYFTASGARGAIEEQKGTNQPITLN